MTEEQEKVYTARWEDQVHTVTRSFRGRLEAEEFFWNIVREDGDWEEAYEEAKARGLSDDDAARDADSSVVTGSGLHDELMVDLEFHGSDNTAYLTETVVE